MKLEIDTIKLEFSKDELNSFRAKIIEVLNQHPIANEEQMRSQYPKINEILHILDVDTEKIPF